MNIQENLKQYSRYLKLKELLKAKETLYNDNNINEDVYYMMLEKIDNEIANNYTQEEIEEIEKEK